MGFEVFRVELRNGATTYAKADEIIQTLPQVSADEDSIPTPGSKYYRIDDGLRIIEVELLDSPVRLSCRFTLCHPPSVDAFFLDVIHVLMMRLGLRVRICDDVLPEHSGFFSVLEFATFSSITLRYISLRRTEWIAAFGNNPMAATTNDVYARIIFPRSEVSVQQPT